MAEAAPPGPEAAGVERAAARRGRVGGGLVGRMGPRGAQVRVALHLVPVLLVGATLLARAELAPHAGGTAVSIIFVPAILLSAHLGGLVPGLVATLLACLGSAYFLMPPDLSFAVGLPTHRVQLGLMLVSGAAISLVIESLHRTRWSLVERTESVRESEERLRLVVQAAGEGIVLERADGVVEVFNPAAERLAGRAMGRTQGPIDAAPGWYTVREDGTALPPEERPNKVALATGQATSNVVMGVHRPDGRVTWLSVNSEPVFRAGERSPHAVVWTFVDVTAQRRQAAVQRELEAQLQQARKLESIGRLAGGIAHDFNNLLTVILSCAETMKIEAAAGSAVQPEVIEELQGAGLRAAELTRQLLAFARKQVIAPVPLDLNESVRVSARLLDRVLGEDVELVTSRQPGLWTVRCDPGQIEQVILNLALNARDAMPHGGTLTIETGNVEVDERFVAVRPFMRTGPYVRLRIADTGVGMTPEARAHAFEPFFTTKAVGKGTGLGLATVYGIVKQSEGYVLLESEAGRGTTFDLFFPRAREAGAAASAPPPVTAPRRGTETVLVVEDDPAVREITTRSLSAGGYRVIVARDGREALEVSAREVAPVDLLVTDMIMPGFNGRQVAAELRLRRPGLRVLYVSGYAGDLGHQPDPGDPGLELLEKPFTSAALLARVRAVLDAP